MSTNQIEHISSKKLRSLLADTSKTKWFASLDSIRKSLSVKELQNEKLMRLANAGMLERSKEGISIFKNILESRIEDYLNDLNDDDKAVLKELTLKKILSYGA